MYSLTLVKYMLTFLSCVCVCVCSRYVLTIQNVYSPSKMRRFNLTNECDLDGEEKRRKEKAADASMNVVTVRLEQFGV